MASVLDITVVSIMEVVVSVSSSYAGLPSAKKIINSTINGPVDLRVEVAIQASEEEKTRKNNTTNLAAVIMGD